MKSSYFSGTGAGAKVPATQLALVRLVVVVLLLVALVAAACNSWFLMWLSLREVTGGITRYLSRVRNNPPLSRSLQGHKVQLMAKQALALGSLLVGFAGESLASSSHGFQSCSNGTPYKWQAPTCVPFQGERWHSKVKKAEVRLNWYALSWSETSHVQRKCVERFSWRLPVSNCANHHSSNLRSCESIYEYFVFELEMNVWIHASNAIIHLCVLQCDFVPL